MLTLTKEYSNNHTNLATIESTIEKSQIKIDDNGNGGVKKLPNAMKYEIIHVTQDYDQFKELEFNRNHSEIQIKKLMKIMDDIGFIPAFHITINDNFEIIDGQHRKEAAKRLGIPVYYCFSKYYDVNLVVTLNNSSRPWLPIDYLKFYVYFKKEDYIITENFLDKYKISLSCATYMLNGQTNYHGQLFINFKQGKFKIRNLKQATEFMEYVEKFKAYKFYKKNKFILALWKIYNSQKFKPSHMIKNYNKFPEKLEVKAASSETYCQLLEWVYNVDLPKNDRLNFKSL